MAETRRKKTAFVMPAIQAGRWQGEILGNSLLLVSEKARHFYFVDSAVSVADMIWRDSE
jgi:hypothetical protein